MTILTVKWQKHNRQDITVLHKDTQEWTQIDKVVPVDQNVLTIEEEKVEKYQDLALENQKCAEPRK